MKKVIVLVLLSGVLFSCKKKAEDEATTEETPTTPVAEKQFPDTAWSITSSGPHLIFKFKFDSTQVRLDNLGNPSTIPAGHGAYSPVFNQMASHYVELAQTDLTAFGAGKVLYHAPETAKGGTTAIEFVKSTVVREGAIFYAIPITPDLAGDYKWLRLSLSYQNYDIPYKANAIPGNHIGSGTIASFLGYNTYVERYKIKDNVHTPSASVGGPYVNHKQGYWGFGTYIPGYGYYPIDGQAPAGATTVVNPNATNSPVPAGSCVVTGQFTDMTGTNQVLHITGTETQNIIVTVSISTNKSFEWNEVNVDGYYQPEAGEAPVDMGVRGMIPKVQY